MTRVIWTFYILVRKHFLPENFRKITTQRRQLWTKNRLVVRPRESEHHRELERTGNPRSPSNKETQSNRTHHTSISASLQGGPAAVFPCAPTGEIRHPARALPTLQISLSGCAEEYEPQDVARRRRRNPARAADRATACLHTHTHTHAAREREREKDATARHRWISRLLRSPCTVTPDCFTLWSSRWQEKLHSARAYACSARCRYGALYACS